MTTELEQKFLEGYAEMRRRAKKIEDDIEALAEWSEETGIPVNIGMPSSQTERYYPKAFDRIFSDLEQYSEAFDNADLDLFVLEGTSGEWWYNSSC